MSDNSGMNKDTYIKLLEAKIADLEQRMVLLKKCNDMLEKRNQVLEQRLGVNSQNSSKPPSFNPLGPAVLLPR